MIPVPERRTHQDRPGPPAGFRKIKPSRSEIIIRRLLAQGDIRVDGDRDWDIRVNNRGFYTRLLVGGSLGLGESYVDGWWDCPRVDEFIHRALRADLKNKVSSWKDRLGAMQAKIMNMQSVGRAFLVGLHHYDKGNDLYEAMLDSRLIYSCGYWKEAKNLEEAQVAKLELTCKKLDIQPGMKVLDIGCGWGGTAKYIAERYGAEVVGVTVSEEQAKLARQMTAGLPVEIKLQDYRSLDGCFDRILSIGMFEHVGYKNHKVFMQTVRRLLKESGLFLLHTIGSNNTSANGDPWLERYIFPNSNLPSVSQLSKAFEGTFVLEDWHGFGAYYDQTLLAWHKRFNDSWSILKSNPAYDQHFYRMWNYYLLCCAGSFRARYIQLWQLVLSPKGISGCYQCPR